MPGRLRAVALLRAVLLENCGSDEAAAQHLAQAERLGVDPLDYCAHRFGLGTALTWERAAQWAGFYSFRKVPQPPAGSNARMVRPDLLGGIRSLRQSVLGREIVFCAPTFAQILNLAAARSGALVRRTCIVPPDAIETALTATMSEPLMDEARQRLTRHWAGATASVGLPKYARLSFALLLIALVVLVMIGGTLSRDVLLPLTALLLVGPGIIRLIATLPQPARSPVRLLADRDLPVYSVLIPLRDEAHMVPMLRRAMSAIDYPVLWSSYT